MPSYWDRHNLFFSLDEDKIGHKKSEKQEKQQLSFRIDKILPLVSQGKLEEYANQADTELIGLLSLCRLCLAFLEEPKSFTNALKAFLHAGGYKSFPFILT